MSQPKNSEQQWLVRRAGNPILIGGPYLTDQVREMLTSGSLDSDDELCVENSYWFTVHEKEEVLRLLGVTRSSASEQKGLREDETAPDLELTPIDVTKRGSKTHAATPQAHQRLKVAQPLSLRSAGEFSAPTRIWVTVLYVSVIAAILGVVWVLRTLNL